jgi:hypothetical protein
LNRGRKTLIRVDRPQWTPWKEVGKRQEEKTPPSGGVKAIVDRVLHRTFGLTAPFNASPGTNLACRSSVLVLRLSPATGLGAMNHPGGRGNPNEI